MKRKITTAFFVFVITTGIFAGCGNTVSEGKSDSVMAAVIEVMAQAEEKKAEIERVEREAEEAAERAAAEAKAKEEAERKAREEAKRKAEEERLAKEAEEQARIEAEKRAEEERLAKEAEEAARIEAERKAEEERQAQEAAAKAQAEAEAKAAAEAQAKAEAEAKAQAEAQAAAQAQEQTQTTQSSGATYTGYQIYLDTDLLALVNADRSANGVGELVWSDSLAEYCKACIPTIVSNYYAGINVHEGCDGYENIARGQRSSDQVNQCWIESEGHHTQRLYSGHTQYAAATYRDENGNIFWIEAFN